MIKAAIEKIQSLVELSTEQAINIGGREYWRNSGHPIKPPTVSPVASVKTLDALLSALDAPELLGLTEDCLGAVQIVVADPRNVSIVSAPDNTWAQREHYIDAECKTQSFPFGQFMDIETFIIKAQCLFVDNDHKTAMIAHVSGIVGEETIENADDGVAQTVVVRDSLNRAGRAKFTPILSLRPYRTFPEVEQPESAFLLRMRKSGDKSVEVALFEADGGLWIAQACANIAAHLRADTRVQAGRIAVIG